ncbi:DUF484 family protein [Pseudoalteromonas sp. R3]|uniref:DUF484 family protein n=1 Tax=Pseudoalteromonas sp. R3 TaxID=1709477 RepID=UPI0006B416DD|nr:DUF484 family protein [Pseudoalteromonas sp. R3]AZZ96646.1 DUF484 family protein [Pseudoalteromonas sp. R3]
MSSNAGSVTHQQVQDFLHHNPEFLLQHPYLLLELNLYNDSQGAPNLALLQQRTLRERNQQLEKQIAQMVAHANENEQIYRLFSECQRRLWQCQDVSSLGDLLSHELTQLPKVSHCQLINLQEDNEQVSAVSALQSSRLRGSSCYQGRLSQAERAGLLEDAQCQSFALYTLGDSETPKAMLLFASYCADHFAPGNGDLFVSELVTSLTLRLHHLA